MEPRHDGSASEDAVDEGANLGGRRRLADGVGGGPEWGTDDADCLEPDAAGHRDADDTGGPRWVRA